MPDSAAFVFALSMLVWVADVRSTPKPVAPEAPSPTSSLSCQSGPSSAAPDGADAEVVVCAARAR
jgi:hypothetical protein